MVIRIMDGAFAFWCLVGCLLVAGPLQMVHAQEDTLEGELLESSEFGSISPEDLCQSLCGECQCRGRLVSENQCQCSCDFGAYSAGGQQCTWKVQELCNKMDVECEFNEVDVEYRRESRGCHTMNCYEKHHEEGDYEGYHDGGEGYGHEEGHGHKQLVCCKEKHKHKEKKHKHKKHKKHFKHKKFHIVIKGKIPEHSCEGGHEEEEHYEGYEDHGYRAMPDRPKMKPAPMPMDVSVWTNRQKPGKKYPHRKPVHHKHPAHHGPPQPYGPPPSYGPPPPPYPVDPRAKAADSPALEPRPEPMPEPMHHPQDTQPPQGPPPPQPPPPPPPAEKKSPPVTPFPEHRPTPPPNLYDGAPVAPKPSTQNSKQEPPKYHSFSPPSPPLPPPLPPSPPARPSMITVAPPPRRIESSRSFNVPSYSSCPFESYDFNFYHPPPPPPPSSYRSFSSSYDPSYPSSHYDHSHDEYDPPKYYPAYEKPVELYDDNGDSEYDSYKPPHGVHPLTDNEMEDWPEFPTRSPREIFTFNQIVSRQIFEADLADRYTDKPFQPTPRPLRDEFEPPTAEIVPVQYESYGPPEKNYDMELSPTPPPDAFIPAVPPPPSVPVEFADPESGPVTYAPNSEEALYPQPTPPPHYLLAKEAGSMSSFGFEQHRWADGGSSFAYGRSAAGPSHFRAASRRTSAPYHRYH